MKSFQCHIFREIFRKNPYWAILFLLVAATVGCGNEVAPVTVEAPIAPSSPVAEATGDFLVCPDCQLVDVIEVIDANTVRTAIGDIAMYGAYVVDQPADCAQSAQEQLTSLASGSIRIEPGPPDTVRNDTHHYYLYTVHGKSIEESLVRDGLALIWTQDGQHLGWFVFRDADEKSREAGCLWKGYSAFQRGESSEFRIPGLTYPDTD